MHVIAEKLQVVIVCLQLNSLDGYSLDTYCRSHRRWLIHTNVSSLLTLLFVRDIPSKSERIVLLDSNLTLLECIFLIVANIVD